MSDPFFATISYYDLIQYLQNLLQGVQVPSYFSEVEINKNVFLEIKLNNITLPSTLDELFEFHENVTTSLLLHTTNQALSGNFQTRKELSDYIVSYLTSQANNTTSESRSKEFLVMDPTCGTGIFLLQTLVHYQRSQQLQTRDLVVVGIEREITLVIWAWLTLQLARTFSNEDTAIHIYHADILNIISTNELASFYHSIDLVIGNPPWITWTDLPESDRDSWKNLETISDFQLVNASKMDKAMGQSNIDIGPLIFLLIIHQFNRPSSGFPNFGFLFKPGLINSSSMYWYRQGRTPHTQPRTISLTELISFLNPTEHFISLDMTTDCYIGTVFDKLVAQKSPSQNKLKKSNIDSLVNADFGNKQHLQAIEVFNPADVFYVDHRFDQSILRNILHNKHHDTVEIRHGIKHDCREVFEVDEKQAISLNWEAVYPTIKSRHIKKQGWTGEFDLVIVPNTSLRHIDEISFAKNSPTTYAYLQNHQEQLLARKSRWVKQDAFYSIFGVGDYSFATYKVVWVRLGWKPYFSLIEPVTLPSGETKPVIPSDHFLFIPTENKEYAMYLVDLLNSAPYQELLFQLSSKKKSSLPKKLIARLYIPTEEEYLVLNQN